MSRIIYATCLASMLRRSSDRVSHLARHMSHITYVIGWPPMQEAVTECQVPRVTHHKCHMLASMRAAVTECHMSQVGLHDRKIPRARQAHMTSSGADKHRNIPNFNDMGLPAFPYKPLRDMGTLAIQQMTLIPATLLNTHLCQTLCQRHIIN